ncbi:CPBP family intramembrane glutamic endopeptidase [Pseudonocardia sp.]|uniref:CPBP family intramembrane glutamic endopeptidase n=1 Tax=Pseudonocardia sp. TaxID=60912 RepID=UPI003D11047F
MSTLRHLSRRHRLALFFGLTFLVSWAAWPFTVEDPVLLTFGPLTAALVVVGLTEGAAGYRDLLQRLLRWRIGWWWVVAAGTPLAVLAVASLAGVAVWGAPVPDLAGLGWGALAASAALRLVNPGDGPAGEEPGWRGYAQPRLQALTSPLGATSVLAVFATLWHLPLVVAGSLPVVGLPVTFAITFVYAWLFNRTGGSLLATLVFHVLQGTVTYQALGFTGADAERMDLLTGALWVLLAVAVVTLDRRVWRVAPEGTVTDVAPREPTTPAAAARR